MGSCVNHFSQSFVNNEATFASGSRILIMIWHHIRTFRLISPFGNAAFLSPHFDDGTKRPHWTEVRHVARTRSVRHRSLARPGIVQRRICAHARVHVGVQKGDIIPVNAMQARWSESNIRCSLLLPVPFFSSASRESPRTPGGGITSAGPPFGRPGHRDIACFIGA